MESIEKTNDAGKKKMSTKKKVIISISTTILVILLALITTGLLFAYKPHLFTNYNRSRLGLNLEHRNIVIPLYHKYKYYTPTNHTIQTESSIEEITEKFSKELKDTEYLKETLVVKKIRALAPAAGSILWKPSLW